MSAAATAAGYLYASGRLRNQGCMKRRFDSELQALLKAPKPGSNPKGPRWRAVPCRTCIGRWHLESFYARPRG